MPMSGYMNEDVSVQPNWTATDEGRATDALHRNFGEQANLAWLWPTSTDREWAGTKRGKSVPDTRVAFKNNAEYHGLETHAWQFMATAQYDFAADYFYVAALWRQLDAEFIGDTDAGHARAEAICLRCARFAQALSHRPRFHWPEPEKFGLTSKFVQEREAAAQSKLNAVFEEDRS